MTKMHFEALAGALRENRPRTDDAVLLWLEWHEICRAVARVCKQYNFNFDWDRFIAACEREK